MTILIGSNGLPVLAGGLPLAVSVTPPAVSGLEDDFGSTLSSVSVAADRTTGVAPFGTFYRPSASSTEARVVSAFHDIEWSHRFGDSGSYSALGSNVVWGADKNLAYGPVAIYVHDTPGSYDVYSMAFDGASGKKASRSITVEDPDTVFSGTQTAVVSSASNYAGKPTGASEHTTIASALSSLTGNNRRILLRRGESYSNTITFSAGQRVYVGWFGTESDAKPQFDLSSGTAITFNNSASFTEIVVNGIEVYGGNDPTNPSTSEPSVAGIDFGGATPLCPKTVWDCDFDGLAIAVTLGSANDVGNVIFGNCTWPNRYNYCVFGGDVGAVGWVGCDMTVPDATRNGAASDAPPYYTRGPAFRLSRPNDVTVISNCHSSAFTHYQSSSSSRIMYNNFRWNSGEPDQELVIDRLRCEGGEIRTHNNTSGSEVEDQYAVIDRMVTINTSHQKACVSMPNGGVTMRNSIIVLPNTPSGSSTGMQGEMVDSDPSKSDATVATGAQTRRSEVYSCTMANLASDANSAARGGSNDRPFDAGNIDDISTRFFDNNLHYSPNMSTGAATDYTPVSTTGVWTVQYGGERWLSNSVDTTRNYGNECAALFIPETGSAAIGGASGKVSILTWDGTRRQTVLDGLTRTAASLGPHEPALES